jgi:hypothetical protein
MSGAQAGASGHGLLPPSPTDGLAPSRLYPLVPIGGDSVLVESLSSYLNRLGWCYRVSVRTLIALEILPRLRPGWSVRKAPAQLGGFGRARAMAINGAGTTAADWSRVLEQLTAQADLRRLTLLPWGAGLSDWGLLRPAPAWCPACLDEWRQHGAPIAFPLVWMLQLVTHCVRHARPLVDRCACCAKRQSALAAKSPPGCCTQCHAWLGEVGAARAERGSDDEVAWQRWVLEAVDELRQAAPRAGVLSWTAFPAAIAACVQAIGSTRKLGRRVQASGQLLGAWQRGSRQPSLTYLARVCYVLSVTPLQLLQPNQEALRTALANASPRPVPGPWRRMPRVSDLTAAQACLEAVADGRDPPLPVPVLARRLAVGEKLLVRRFPALCARITARCRAHRAARATHRVLSEQAEVQQVVQALHADGIVPSRSAVSARLSDPHLLRRPAALAAWRRLRRDLGSSS